MFLIDSLILMTKIIHKDDQVQEYYIGRAATMYTIWKMEKSIAAIEENGLKKMDNKLQILILIFMKWKIVIDINYEMFFSLNVKIFDWPRITQIFDWSQFFLYTISINLYTDSIGNSKI